MVDGVGHSSAAAVLACGPKPKLVEGSMANFIKLLSNSAILVPRCHNYVQKLHVSS